MLSHLEAPVTTQTLCCCTCLNPLVCVTEAEQPSLATSSNSRRAVFIWDKEVREQWTVVYMF